MGPEGWGELGWVRAPARAAKRRAGRTRESFRTRRIAGLEELREVGEEVVAECSGGAVEDQHTAGAALGGRVLGDEFGGKVEMEVGDEHRVGAERGIVNKFNFAPHSSR